MSLLKQLKKIRLVGIVCLLLVGVFSSWPIISGWAQEGKQPEEKPLTDNAIVNWINVNISSEGMPFSFQIPEDKLKSVFDKTVDKYQWMILRKGAVIYDVALAQILWTYTKDLKSAEKIIEIFRQQKEDNPNIVPFGSLDDLHAWFGNNEEHPFRYNEKESGKLSRKNPLTNRVQGYLFKIIPATGEYQADYEFIDLQTWQDWSPISGENAWAGVMASLHLYYQKYGKAVYHPEAAEMKLAEDIASAAILLQSEKDGEKWGIRMGPLGTWSKEEEGLDWDKRRWWYDEISTENNLSWYAAVRMLDEITHKPEYKTALKGIERYLKENFEGSRGYFLQGRHFTNGSWVPKLDPAFATDCQTWAIDVLGPAVIDDWFGEGTAYRLWDKTKMEAGVFDGSDKLQGVDFTNYRQLTREAMVSYEWTAGTILATRILDKFYRNSHPDWADICKDDGRNMLNFVHRKQVQIDEHRIAWPYASGNQHSIFRPTGFGWYASPEEVLSLASTAWMGLIELNLNPFFLGGESPEWVSKLKEDTEPPILIITSHKDYAEVSRNGFNLEGTAEDVSGIDSVDIILYDFGAVSFMMDWTPAKYDIASRKWSFKVLSDYLTGNSGVYFRIRAKDTKGNAIYKHLFMGTTGTPADTTLPTVTITSPKNNTVVSRKGFDFTGTAEDPSGIAGVYVMVVYPFGKRADTVYPTLVDSYNLETKEWKFSVPSPVAGQKAKLLVRAKNLNNKWSPWQVSIVNVDTSAKINITTSGPSNGEVITTNTVTFTWSGSGGSGNLQYAYYLKGLETGYGAFGSDTSKTYKDLSNKSYTFYVKVRDDAGQEAEVSRMFTVKATPLNISIVTGPSNGELIATNTVTFTWTGSGGSGNLKYAYYLKGLDTAYGAFGSDTNKTYKDLANKEYTFYVKVRDDAGQEAEAPRMFTVKTTTVKTPPLNISIVTGPATGDVIATNTVTFTWSGSGGSGNLRYAYCLKRFGFDTAYGEFGSDTSRTYKDLINESDTFFVVYMFYVKVRDDGGNEAEAVRMFTVKTTPLNISIVTGPANGELIATNTVTFTWTGTGGSGNLKYAYYLKGIDTAYGAFGSDTNKTYKDLANKEYTFYVKVRDDAANETEVSRTFTVKTTPLNISIVTGPANGELIATNTVTFTWTGTGGSGNLKYAYYLKGLDTAYGAFGSDTSKTYKDLANKEYTFYVKVKDDAANETEVSRMFTVKTTSLNISIVTGPANGELIATNTVTFTWTGSGGSGNLKYAYYLKGLDTAYGAFGSDTSRTYNGLANKDYTFYVKVKDEAGQEAEASRTFTVSVDTTPPGRATNLSAVAGDKEVSLDWDDNKETDLAGYWVYRLMTQGESYTKINPSLITVSTYKDTTVDNGKTYYYVVTVQDNKGNESPYSEEVAATPTVKDATAPDTSITEGPNEGQTITTSSVTFKWSGSGGSGNLQYAYYLEGLESGYGAYTNETTKTYSNLANKSYKFYIKAKDDAGNEETSPDMRSFTVSVDTTPPGRATNLSAVAGDKEVSLDWDDNKESDLAGYWVYRGDPSMSKDRPYTKIYPSLITVSTYKDTTVDNGKTYYYVVTAQDSSGNESPYSDEVKATPTVKDATLPDTDITDGPNEGQTITTSSVTFKWSGSGGSGNLQYAYYLKGLNTGYGAFGSDTSKTYENLANNTYTFYVKVRDEAGKEGTSPATRSFTVNVATGETQHPWADNEYGELEDITHSGTVGYKFSPQKDGKVTKLGGYFKGTKKVSLWDASTKKLLASVEVNSSSNWSYRDIIPVNVTAGRSYIVAVYVGGTGGTGREFGSGRSLPQTFKDIKIESNVQDFGDTIPIYGALYHMQGQVDIEFMPGGGDVMDPIPPETNITDGPGEGQTITSRTVTFKWTGSDDKTAVGNLKYAYYLQGVEVGYGAFSSDTSKTYQNLANKSYKFYVKAKDETGNEDASPATRSFTVKVESGGDDIPPVSSASPKGKSYMTSPVTETITITASDNKDPSPTIYYTIDGSEPNLNSPNDKGKVILTLVITDKTILRFFSRDESLNSETPIHTEEYKASKSGPPSTP